jgi:Putative Ig domain/Galactose oxidase, central domain
MNSTHREARTHWLTSLSQATTGRFLRWFLRSSAMVIALISFLTSHETMASGTWAPLATAPATGVNCCMLLGDGTVLTYDGSGNCNRLTPDIHGNYRLGTWTRLAKMNNSRLFFASALLTNGNVFVAGGEYGPGHDRAELFDPLNNIWTKIPDPAPGVGFSDAISKILPNGNVLVAPVSLFGGCLIYNVNGNSWQTAASSKNQNEVCWVKLPNDNILTIDTGAQTSEHYVPSLNTWIVDNNLPVPVYGYGAEIGAGFLLPNGTVFYIGGNTNTAIYTPGPTVTSAGTWVAGPTMVFDTNQLGAVDAPATMMANGKILCALGPTGGFNAPTSFYEYDYVANSFTQVNGPTGLTYGPAPFTTSMLDLPDGTVLFVGGQNSTSLYIYTPDGTPLPAGQPVINSITQNADGSYHLTGTGLTGISEGAAYGDDEQMNSNYPLVRMTNNVTGNVYYARTYNWNSTSVQTGSRVLATEFSLPQNLPTGLYSLIAVANGNPSVGTNFTYSPPPIPTGLTAVSGSNGFVGLNWNASSGATAYNVKRSSLVGGYYATIATVTGLSFTNTSLINGLAYYYKVSAIGSGGPSSDSAAVMAVPAGPPLIPGATPVNLSAYYNRAGIYTDGRTFSTGIDGGSSAYSANLLGPSLLWNNLVFGFGPSNALDVVFCAGQVINLPPGRFNSLQILATGVQGNQLGQTFTVTYTDSTIATFTQNFSDWANPQSYQGEFTATTMRYRNQSSGGSQTLNVTVDGYVFPLDQTKTVQSVMLPVDVNVVVLSMVLANDPVCASLAGFYNRAGIYTDGTTFTNPPTGGLDGGGSAYSGTLLGNSQTWSNTLFAFGPLNATNVISCANQTIPLLAGNYSRLRMLATGINGNQPSQSFLVTYADSTTTTFVQSMSDWFTPQSYPGESKAVPMGHRDNSNGGTDGRPFYLYGYSFNLNTAKTIQSVRVPSNANVIVTAISLVPDWEPIFNVNPLTLANANAGQAYSGTVATNASDLNGDALTFAKVSGPAWLNVASNGSLSGTPLSPDVGNNSFVVSVADGGGFSSTGTVNVSVSAAAPIISTISAQVDGLLLSWSGGIPPYQVQATTNLLSPDWQDISGPVSGNSLSITATNDAVFYRIGGQ